MRPSMLTYRSFPVRDDYPRSLALVAIVVAVGAGVGVSFGAAFWFAFSVAVLVATLARYFFPTEYTLDETGVRTRFLGIERARAWSEIRALYPHRDGVHLSPFASPRALDPFRGMFLRFAGNRDDVLRFCESHAHAQPTA